MAKGKSPVCYPVLVPFRLYYAKSKRVGQAGSLFAHNLVHLQSCLIIALFTCQLVYLFARQFFLITLSCVLWRILVLFGLFMIWSSFPVHLCLFWMKNNNKNNKVFSFCKNYINLFLYVNNSVELSSIELFCDIDILL